MQRFRTGFTPRRRSNKCLKRKRRSIAQQRRVRIEMRAIPENTAEWQLLFWSILNHEGARLKNRIVRKWERLLDDNGGQEEEYHKFFHDNAAWFFSDGVN